MYVGRLAATPIEEANEFSAVDTKMICLSATLN